MNSVQVFMPCFFQTHFNVLFCSYMSTRFLFCGVSSQNSVCVFRLSHTCYAPPPPPPVLKSVWLGHPDKCSAKCVISAVELSPDRQVKVVRFAIEPRDSTKMSRPDRGPAILPSEGVKLPTYPQRSPRLRTNGTAFVLHHLPLARYVVTGLVTFTLV